MTLVVLSLCSEGLVMGSDSNRTDSDLLFEGIPETRIHATKKILRIAEITTLIGISGAGRILETNFGLQHNLYTHSWLRREILALTNDNNILDDSELAEYLKNKLEFAVCTNSQWLFAGIKREQAQVFVLELVMDQNGQGKVLSRKRRNMQQIRPWLASVGCGANLFQSLFYGNVLTGSIIQSKICLFFQSGIQSSPEFIDRIQQCQAMERVSFEQCQKFVRESIEIVGDLFLRREKYEVGGMTVVRSIRF